MLKAKQIVASLGGAKKLSDSLNLPLTTVASWTAANFIPEWRQRDVLAEARRQNVPLRESDFPTEQERVSRKKIAA